LFIIFGGGRLYIVGDIGQELNDGEGSGRGDMQGKHLIGRQTQKKETQDEKQGDKHKNKKTKNKKQETQETRDIGQELNDGVGSGRGDMQGKHVIGRQTQKQNKKT